MRNGTDSATARACGPRRPSRPAAISCATRPATVSTWNSVTDRTLAAQTATAAAAGRQEGQRQRRQQAEHAQGQDGLRTAGGRRAPQDGFGQRGQTQHGRADGRRMRGRGDTPSPAAHPAYPCIAPPTSLIVPASQAQWRHPGQVSRRPSQGGRAPVVTSARAAAKTTLRRDDPAWAPCLAWLTWKQRLKSPDCASGSGRPWRWTGCPSPSSRGRSPDSLAPTARESPPPCASSSAWTRPTRVTL